ncbi:RagB/SusD family nutrient uptake outer membrane protein [Chitinophaga deserti]|uniref:RagB/SusD family nutrient uptake outer membrane protein n=1 Tax=Chitinophaga deserti TaxID=2164099 RepID=UPI000D6C7F8F|nr:RagB/SusD family nutrient uptake outer membrane protein [Chitinophaga deserti]
MKRNLIILTAIAAGSFFTACNKDFLDREPLDAYNNDNIWKNEADLTAALNGCYKGWEDVYNIIYLDCATDNGYNQWPWEGYTSYGNGSITASDVDAANRWSYTTIQKCNSFLENADKAQMEEAKKNRMKAEARFLRAYQYFTLTQLYGNVPLVTKTVTMQEANTIKQTPIGEVRQFILDELAAIAPQLDVSYTGKDIGRITRGAALALRARLNLYMKKWDDAITDSRAVMQLGYELDPSYSDVFRIKNENNKEVILDVQYMENIVANTVLGIMPSNGYGGWGSIVPSQSLVDAYEMANGKPITDPTSGYNPNDPYTNRDPRLQLSIVTPGQRYGGRIYDPMDPDSDDYYLGDNNSKTGYLYKKWTSNFEDYANIWNTGLNAIIIRYSEVLLTYAEAMIEKGTIDGTVYDAIDLVRKRAKMPVVDRGVYAGQVKMRELVRRERRVELALEGLRWYDVKRWEIGPQVSNGKLYGMRTGTVDPATGKLTLTGPNVEVENRVFDASKNYVWPIPQKEIDVNKNLDQNPNY